MSSSKPSPGWQLLAALAVPMILSAAIALFKRGQRKQSKALVKKGSFQSTTFTVIEENATTGSLETSQQVMGTWTALGLEQAVVIAMVGLPARGKSYLVKMMIRYLKWNGFEADVFNVGSYRRKIGHQSADSTFFSSANPNAKKIREEMAMAVQDFMYSWLHESDDARGRVAVFDATNTTRARRLALARRAKKENVYLLFVESICDDEKTLQRNYDLKLQNDDYKGMDPVQAKLDFLSRVQAYEKVYEVRYAMCQFFCPAFFCVCLFVHQIFLFLHYDFE
jgi:predicted kinase